MKTTVFMAAVTLLITSCNVLRVSKGDGAANTQCEGIPFYVQKEVYKQETKYQYTWIEVSLSSVQEKEGAKPSSTTIWRLTPDDSLIRYLNSVTSMTEMTVDEVNNFLKQMEKSKAANLNPDSNSIKQVISNSCKPELIVDYSTKYYLNARKPLFGNTTVTQKLAPNGTLSESSATVESSLDEIAIAAIGLATPLASIKVAQIGAAVTSVAALQPADDIKMAKEAGGKAKINPVSDKIKYTISIREAGYIYTFTKYHDSFVSCNSQMIKPNLSQGNFSRTAYTAQESESKDNKKAIKVEGSIELPEAK